MRRTWPLNILAILDELSLRSRSETALFKPSDPEARTTEKTTTRYREEVCLQQLQHVGLYENSVPLKPMVNDHYPY